jgi:hypothetical protein
MLAASLPMWAQEAVGGVKVSHPVLAASIDRLASDSPSWREAMDAVAASGRRALVVTPDQISEGFDSNDLAGALPIADDQSRVDAVIVIVNLDLLQRLSGLPVGAIQFKDDLDRLMAHEVFGHAVPYLLAGNLSGKCADPAPGQSATDACAIRRENVIRKELGLGRRFDYGRESLALTRRSWQ